MVVKLKKKNYRKIIDFSLVFLIFAIGLVGYFGFFDAQNSCDSDVYRAMTTAALEVQSYVKRAEGHMGLYLSLGNEIDRDKFYARIESMNENINILEQYLSSENDLFKLKRIKDASISFEDSGKALIEFHDDNPEGFEVKQYDYLLLAIRNSAFIIRENAVALAQSSIVTSSIGVSSSIKQAESYLLLLYLNLGEEKYKELYFENIEAVKDDLFILETEVVLDSEIEDISVIKESMEIIEENGNELILLYENNPENFDASDYEEIIREFHDASSLIRETGITLAKEELKIETGTDEPSNLHEYVFAGLVLAALILAFVKLFVSSSKKR